MNIRNLIEPYKKLPKSIYALFFASIINNMGNFVFPMLTLFLTNKGKMTTTTVGTILAINSVFGLIGSLIGGKLIDKIGRKSIFIVFRVISALCMCLCAFQENIILIVILIMCAQLGGGVSSPVYSTIITDLTNGEERKLAFSLEYMAMNIGMAVGPLLAAFLYNRYLQVLFIGDSLTTIMSVLLVARFVPETKPKICRGNSNIGKHNEEGKDKREEESLLSALIKRPAIIVFSFIMVLYFVVFSQYNFGIPLQVNEIFGDKSATVYASLMTINTVLCGVMPMLIAPLLKNIKPSKAIAIGGILYALGFGSMWKISAYPLFALSTALWTFGEILVSTNTNVYIAEHSPVSHRGRFNSVFPVIRKLGFMVGPAIAGVYTSYFSIRQLWILVGIMAIIGSTLMFILYKKDTYTIE